MAYPIEKKLVVAVSSRAVFDLEEANAIFDNKVRILAIVTDHSGDRDRFAAV
jgi:hypothetical protein